MSPLATAVNVHFAASTPNFFILEYSAPDSGARKRRPERADDGEQGRLCGHPEQARLGRGTERRSVQEHAAGAVEARYQFPRGRLALLPIELISKQRRRGTRSSRDDDGAACTGAAPPVAVRHARVEIHRVSSLERVLFPADMYAQRALQGVDELDAGMIVQPHRRA